MLTIILAPVILLNKCELIYLSLVYKIPYPNGFPSAREPPKGLTLSKSIFNLTK